jgi:hypothetical protein
MTLIEKLKDLRHMSVTEHSFHYTASVIAETIVEIERLQAELATARKSERERIAKYFDKMWSRRGTVMASDIISADLIANVLSELEDEK